jgi:hypothetical protein
MNERCARPLPRSDLGRAAIGAAQQRHRRADDILGNGERIGAGCWNHLDAARCAGRKIDVVQADTQPAHHLELSGGFKNGRGHFRLAANDQGGKFGDDLDDFLFGKPGLHHDV